MMHVRSIAGMRHAFRGEIERKLTRNVGSRFALLASVALALFLFGSCQTPDPIAKEKQRTLTADERYLVQYYMKLAQLRENLHDNPVEAQEKQSALRSEIDSTRIHRALDELEKNPERWLSIYSRINELRYRRGQADTT
jgi:hypothetical protein